MPFARFLHGNKGLVQPRAAWRRCSLLVVLAAAALAGCADRKGPIEAAQQLAEDVYPATLEVIGSTQREDRYEVTFAVKGDPFTHVRLKMPRDPLACRLWEDCESHLRQAYAEGRGRGEQLKAMNEAFQACRVPLLAVLPHAGGGIVYAIELDLGVEDQQPALDRLAECTKAYAEAYGEAMPHDFLIFRPRHDLPGQAARPVTPGTELDRNRQQEPGYSISARAAPAGIPDEDLRIDDEIFKAGPVHDHIVHAARALLRKERPSAVLASQNGSSQGFFRKPRLDPQRVDVVRTYLMACSEDREGWCREDLAFRATYDFTRRKLTELTLLDAPQGLSGLPDLSGRAGN